MLPSAAQPSSRFHVFAAWAGVALLVGAQGACGGGSDTLLDSAAAGSASTSPAPPGPTPPAPSPVPVANLTCSLPGFFDEALARINQFRSAPRNCGARGNFAAAAPLAWNDQLVTAAAGHSQDMAAKNYFDHVSQDGRRLQDRINATGYTWRAIGENITAGQGSVASAIASWQNSPGHCANLMNPAFTHVGLACVVPTTSAAYGSYWTMNLAQPANR